MTNNIPPFVLFGGPQISVDFADALAEHGVEPDLVVCPEAKPVGRKQVMTNPPLADWAGRSGIFREQISDFSDQAFLENLARFDLFVVVAYPKIIPKKLLDMPKHGTINLHPSLLPKYRGPSPIQTAILEDDKNTGISLMLLDEEMDHGPIVAQIPYPVDEWRKNRIHEKEMAELGAQSFLETAPSYLDGSIKPKAQDHDQASYTHKFSKTDFEIFPDDDEYLMYRKYCAFEKPFFIENGKRYIVTEATFSGGRFVIGKVIPEGKNEQPYSGIFIR